MAERLMAERLMAERLMSGRLMTRRLSSRGFARVCLAMTGLLGTVACGGPGAIPGKVLRACDAPGVACEDVRVDPEPDAVVFLVGDAGAYPIAENGLLRDLQSEVAGVATPDVPVTVAFLGDNVYDVGVRAGNADDLAKLDAQVHVVRGTPESRGIFIPGNHDWAGHRDSVSVVCRQADVLADIDRAEPNTNVRMSPIAAIGPETIPIESASGQRLATLVTIDSQLWFAGSDRASCPDGRPVSADAASARRALTRLLEDHRDDFVIVAGHHPLVSGGVHGGGGGWVDRFLYLTRLSPQDLTAGPYAGYSDEMLAVLDDHQGRLLYAAGHDHSMQLHRMGEADRSWHHLVSGSGSKQSGTGELDEDGIATLFAAPLYGFARLDLHVGRPARMTVYVACSEKDLARPEADRPSLCRSASDARARPVFSYELR